MFKRFKALIAPSEITKILINAKIDDSPTIINWAEVKKLAPRLKNPQQKKQLLTQLSQGILARGWCERIKHLMVWHYLIVDTRDQELLDALVLNGLPRANCAKLKKYEDIKEWMHSHVVDYYKSYILKLVMNFDLYSQITDTSRDVKPQSLRSFNDDSFGRSRNSSLSQYKKSIKTVKLSPEANQQMMELVNNSFKLLNLVRTVTETQINFNKMGRYYPEYKSMIDLLRLYLTDIKIYYSFLKKTLDVIFSSYEMFEIELLRHSFSLVNEIVKTSDRLYQFFYNRYYYYSMREFSFPTFYKLDYVEYRKMVKHINKIDPKELEILVEPHDASRSKSKGRARMNKTMATEPNEREHGEEIFVNFEKTLAEYEIEREETYEDSKEI